MLVQKIPVAPVAKPRQTRRDKWKQRPCVLRYRAFCDAVRAYQTVVPENGAHVIFHVEMPRSWSSEKRKLHNGTPHRSSSGDVDNFLKSLLDAVYQDDSGVWDIRVTKLWVETGFIEIRIPGPIVDGSATQGHPTMPGLNVLR